MINDSVDSVDSIGVFSLSFWRADGEEGDGVRIRFWVV